MVIFICGVPASGKSCFGNFLKDKHDFFYIDMEYSPWPDEKIHRTWDLIFGQLGDENRISSFLDDLKTKGNKIVLDLGFVPNDIYFWIVSSLKKLGCRIVWFDCDEKEARERFSKRENRVIHPLVDSEPFNIQMKRIQKNWGRVVRELQPTIVNVLKTDRLSKSQEEIYREVFRGGVLV